MIKHGLSFLFFLVFSLFSVARQPIVINNNSQPLSLTSSLELLPDPFEKITISDIIDGNPVFIATPDIENLSSSIIWARFRVYNESHKTLRVKITIPFSDFSCLFIPQEDGTVIKDSTGDLMNLNQRTFQEGQICFLELPLPPKKTTTCYLKITNNTDLSKDFQDLTFKSLKIYSAKAFKRHFIDGRMAHAFFYGALVVMFFFNLFIFISTRSTDYLFYIFYLLLLIIFFFSNQGYLFESILNDFPKLDLYVRFFSGPLLIITYILFSTTYLKAKEHSPFLYQISKILSLSLLGIIMLMTAGFWRTGRSAMIISIGLSFILILAVASISFRHKYAPAKFFLWGNILLIISGGIYAFEHLFIISQHTFTGYALQVGILVEVILFSLGLADRINFFQRQIIETKYQQEKREKEIEREKLILIEEKNKQLEYSNLRLDEFIYRTAHDLRGPLASMLGLCQLALTDVKDPYALNYLKQLDNTSNKLNNILDKLNTAHTINTTKPQSSKINFENLIRQINIRYSNALNNTIIVNISPSTDFYSDEKMLTHIIGEVMDNAVKFSMMGIQAAPKAELKIFKNKTSLQVIVTDNGIGISDKDAPFVFDLFSKAAIQYKTPGIGLYTTKSCVEKLNGKIEFKCINNETIFHIELPPLPIY